MGLGLRHLAWSITLGSSFVHSQQDYSRRDRKLAPSRWWCGASRDNSGSMLCKTAILKEAIALATDPSDKQRRVDELRASILKGSAEAEGLDATNPDRQAMMDAWCASDDPIRHDGKSNSVCFKFKAKHDFFLRREVNAAHLHPHTTHYRIIKTHTSPFLA